MEQFDTDEKLVNSNKEEKPKESTINCAQILLLAISCILALMALYCLFKTVKAPANIKTKTFDISKYLNYNFLF